MLRRLLRMLCRHVLKRTQTPAIEMVKKSRENGKIGNNMVHGYQVGRVVVAYVF